ncbi:MAG TPA: polyamine aminopropyltransferase, partial [Armatimonadota bacterium]|nr:polyamine aminopropyltransferase [Armatimonadota bacterium]
TIPFGRMLVLDDATQTSEVEEYLYHEMLVHVPMMAHPDPQRVLVIGGGDGGALRRVLEHPVRKATMVEIDGEVVRVSRALLPAIAGDAFDDPRAELIIGDGVRYLRETDEHFDVILVDSTDPVGPAADLFGESFYRDARRALGEDGLIVTQSGSPLVMLDELKDAVALMRRVFPLVRTYLCAIPLYPGVLWSFTAASVNCDPSAVAPAAIAARLRANGAPTGWYTPAIHRAAFALPNFLAAALEMQSPDDPAALPLPISGE